MVLELGELEYPIFLFWCGTWRWHLNLKNKLGTELMKLEYCLAMSPYYPTLKPFVTHNTQPRTEQNVPTNTKPLNLTISLSQSKAISTQILSFFLSISQILSFSLSISWSASFSVVVSLSVSLSRCCSRSRSPSHKVCLAQLACLACGYFCL